jgi:voltage-gated potassium channel Kch
MLLTPVLFIIYDKIILPRLHGDEPPGADEIDRQGAVVIAGLGRFGQVINRLLIACDVPTVVLDHEAGHIDRLRKFGIKSYYGDASRPDLLQAAGIEKARLFIVAIDDRNRAVQMVEYVKKNYPHVKVLARAYDVRHLYLLKRAGVDLAVKELFNGSLELGAEALRMLGFHPFKVEKMSRAFRTHDDVGVEKLYELWDEDVDLSANRAFLASAREHADNLQQQMLADRMQLHDRTERGWTPPPKGYTDELNE